MSLDIVYVSRDNAVELELHENGSNIPDYSPITRVKLTLDDYDIDSDVMASLFDWSGSSLIIKAGLAGVPAGRYAARLETWDSVNTNGVVWVESLPVHIKN